MLLFIVLCLLFFITFLEFRGKINGTVFMFACIAILFCWGIICFSLLPANQKQTKTYVSSTTKYDYEVSLSNEEKKKAILIEKCGGVVEFKKYRMEAIENNNFFWTAPIYLKIEESIIWEVEPLDGVLK